MLARMKMARGDEFLLAAAQARGAVAAGERKRRREYPDEQRDACDAAHRDGVGQVHGVDCCGAPLGSAIRMLAFSHIVTTGVGSLRPVDDSSIPSM